MALVLLTLQTKQLVICQQKQVASATEGDMRATAEPQARPMSGEVRSFTEETAEQGGLLRAKSPLE